MSTTTMRMQPEREPKHASCPLIITLTDKGNLTSYDPLPLPPPLLPPTLPFHLPSSPGSCDRASE